MQNDELGRASIGRLLFKLALPAIMAQIINVLYNIVDRMYIGQMEGVGALALTGVGVCFPIITLIAAFSALVGVRGAALATILSQAVSGLWVLFFLLGKHTKIRIRLRYMLLDWHIILPVLALGLSPFVMQATESLVQITLNSGLMRYGGDMGDTYVGAMTIINSISQILLLPQMGLGQGAQPIIGFNFGARQYDRVRRAFRLLFISTVIFSMTTWGIVMLFPRVFIRIFNNDPALTDVTVHSLRIFMIALGLMGMQNACQQTLMALGQAKASIFIAMLRKIVLLIPLAIIFPHFWGTTGIFVAEPVSDFISVSCALCIFAVQFRRVMRRAEQGWDGAVPAGQETGI